MTGAYDSVIGFDKEVIVGRFLRQAPVRFEVARAPGHLAAALIDIDFPAKKATAIRHVMVPPL
jgi:2',3'-cyclic-nucleotide 2'-phosphodiesterase